MGGDHKTTVDIYFYNLVTGYFWWRKEYAAYYYQYEGVWRVVNDIGIGPHLMFDEVVENPFVIAELERRVAHVNDPDFEVVGLRVEQRDLYLI